MTTQRADLRGLVEKAYNKVRTATLFADGVEADLHLAGVKTIADAYATGRQDGINEMRGEVIDALESALSAPGEPVGWVVRSKRDGSVAAEFAPADWSTTAERIALLKADPWVLKGLSEVVPVYLSPHAHAEGGVEFTTPSGAPICTILNENEHIRVLELLTILREPNIAPFPSGATLCDKCCTAAVVMMDGGRACLNCGASNATPAPVKVAESQFAKARAKLLAELRATALALDSGDAEVCGDVVREWVSQLEDADNADFHDRLYPAPVPVPAAEREPVLAMTGDDAAKRTKP